ncbi:hypothetical protein E1293_08095 [Actinomadura darangshiensis]|uniref:Uncharacterized protein n=1 Tax=Actinomadura darangshiensis TaxID=705336 RepID=A0A4V2YX44_9ACTN|nr:hypothetical protein [Actinomadura darangshiensis]TDD87357.1 hypothetical protein E1293_08095 [Actinomadura darangshiensis]
MSSELPPPSLHAPLTDQQKRLLQVVYDGFSARASWPVWQYVDLRLDAEDIDAEAVLASLPRLAEGWPGVASYGLVSTSDSGPHLRTTTVLRLTAAGLRLIPGTEPLQSAFLAAIQLMTERERAIQPDPTKEVLAHVDSEDVKSRLWSHAGKAGGPPPSDLVLAAVGTLLANEPLRAWSGLGTRAGGGWQMRLLTGLGGIRAMRGVESIDEYVERILQLLTPAPNPTPPRPVGHMDLPQAIDYLDVVWKLKTGQRLFAGLHMANCARLAQPCASEEEFNPAMSALAEVFACVVPIGRMSPPRTGALSALKDALPEGLAFEGKGRIKDSIDTLRKVVVIRNGQQHGDAKSKAVTAYRDLGISYPPYDPGHTWTALVIIAQGAVDAIREEIQAGLPDWSPPTNTT